MRTKIFSSILLCFLFLIYIKQAFCLIWPFDNVSSLIKTYGDWNGSMFHEGVDIPASTGASVKSVKDGYVIKFLPIQGYDGWIIIGDAPNSTEGWQYRHIGISNSLLDSLKVNPQYFVDEGDVIGYVAVGKFFEPHLHFAAGKNKDRPDWSIGANPLTFYSGSLPTQTPIIDPSKIFFTPDNKWNPNKFIIYEGKRVIYKDVDIVVEPHTRVGTREEPGIYTLSFQVTNPPPKSSEIAERTLVKFGKLTDITAKQNLVYIPALQPIDANHFHGHYVVTNCGTDSNVDGVSNVKENAWFTKVKDGIDDSNGGITSDQWAKTESKARYKDGEYTVKIKAGAYGVSTLAEQSVQVIVDNFAPYLREVKIEHRGQYKNSLAQTGTVIYHAKWDNESETTRKLTKLVNTPVEKNGTLQFEIVFSEGMDPSTIKVSFHNPDNLALNPPIPERPITQNAVWSSTNFENDTWTAEYPITNYDEYDPVVGWNYLIVECKDLAGNNFDGKPETVAYRDDSDIWRNYEDENGIDTGAGGRDHSNHIFRIHSTSLAIMIDSWKIDGGTESFKSAATNQVNKMNPGTDNVIIADFSFGCSLSGYWGTTGTLGPITSNTYSKISSIVEHDCPCWNTSLGGLIGYVKSCYLCGSSVAGSIEFRPAKHYFSLKVGARKKKAIMYVKGLWTIPQSAFGCTMPVFCGYECLMDKCIINNDIIKREMKDVEDLIEELKDEFMFTIGETMITMPATEFYIVNYPLSYCPCACVGDPQPVPCSPICFTTMPLPTSARAKGGYFFNLSASDDIAVANQIISNQSSTNTISKRYEGVVSNDIREYYIPLDSSIEKALFTLNFPDTISFGSLLLYDPDGILVSPVDTTIEHNSNGRLEFYQITSPKPGLYRAVVNGSGDYGLDVSFISPLTFSLLSLDTLAFNGSNQIRAQIDGKVNNPTFQFFSLRGDFVSDVSLYDDGLHNDSETGDGIFAGEFTPTIVGYYRLRMSSVDTMSNVIEREARQSIEISPPIPTNFTVTGGANIGTGKLKLTWSAIPTTIPVHYFVYYDTVAGSYSGNTAIEGASPIDIGDTTSFILSGLVPEKTYYISISVYEPISGLESERTNEVSEPCGNNTPAPITTLTVSSVEDHSVKLKWIATGDDSITGTASAYDIRYSTTLITDSTYNTSLQIGNNPMPSESGIVDSVIVVGLQSSTTYYFAMKVRDEANNWSLLSNIAICTTLRDTTPPENITSVSIFSGDNFITLKWKRPQDGDFAGVLIVEKLGSEPTFTPISSTNYEIGDTVAISEIVKYNGNDTVFTSTGLTNGVIYHHKIFAYDGVPNYSSGVIINAIPIDTIPPGNVTSLSAFSGDRFITINWIKPIDNDIVGILIVRKQSTSPIFTPLDSVIYEVGDSIALDETIRYNSNGTSFTDSSLTNGIAYYYRVFTYDEVPNYSSGVMIHSTSRDTVPPSSVKDLIISMISDTSVTLKWTTTGDDDTIGIATKYDIRYYIEPITDTTWYYAVKVPDSLAPIPRIAGMIDSVTISGLYLKTTYYFALKVGDEVPNWSGFSNVVSVTITSLGKLREQYSLPKTYYLAQNYPNPFNPDTYISYQLPENARVRLKIYNITGQLVKVLVDELQKGGYYNIKWNGKDDKGNIVGSGLYIYRLEAGNFASTKRMVLLK